MESVNITGFRLRTMVRGAEEPGTESSKRSWMSGVWGRVNESGNNIVKSMYSPRRILSVKLLSRGRVRPRGVAAPGLRCGRFVVAGVALARYVGWKGKLCTPVGEMNGPYPEWRSFASQ